MKRKEDLRVRKTKLSLYNGLIKLMEEKSFDDIKVTDICNKALINRSTFYDHFNDKYELYEAYIRYNGTLFDEKIKIDINSSNVNDLFIEYIKVLLDEIGDNYQLYKVLFNNNYNTALKSIFVDIIVDNIMKVLENDYDFNDLSIVRMGVLFYVSGSLDMLDYGFSHNLPFEKEKIIDLFIKIIPDFDIKKK